MPCPVADFIKRPLMTFILVLNGARGESVLLSCMLAPPPDADHSLGLMPQPMNITAKRRGNVASAPPVRTGAGDSAPHAGSDSSQGSAIVTPTPRRNMRRLRTSGLERIGCGVSFGVMGIGVIKAS